MKRIIELLTAVRKRITAVRKRIWKTRAERMIERLLAYPV